MHLIIVMLLIEIFRQEIHFILITLFKILLFVWVGNNCKLSFSGLHCILLHFGKKVSMDLSFFSHFSVVFNFSCWCRAGG